MHSKHQREIISGVNENDRAKLPYDLEVLGREEIIKYEGFGQYYTTIKGNKLRRNLDKNVSTLEKIAAIVFLFLSATSILFFNKLSSFTGFSILKNFNNSKLFLIISTIFFIIAIFFFIKILKSNQHL